MKRLLQLCFYLLANALAGLFPRRSDHWAFGHGGNSFAGNPKYLFLWMSVHRPDIRVTWLTGSARTRRLLASNGFRARKRWSPGGVAAALRARVFAFANGLSDVNRELSRGAILLNLWHGVGLKTTGLGYKGGSAEFLGRQLSSRAGRLRARLMPSADIVATTSDFMQAHFASQFRLPPEACPQLGYPRLDCSADPALAAAARAIDASLGFALNPEAFSEIYIYLPTYRDTGRPFLREALPDPARLTEILAARNALLYIKPHLRTGEPLPPQHHNIRLWPAEVDFHTYLVDFTGLITDYSSVLYDYLAVRDAGAILYTFDFDDYVARDRSMLYPYDENVAGVRVDSFEALCAAIRDGDALAPIEGLDTIRDRFWGGSPRPSSPAVVAYVERLAENR